MNAAPPFQVQERDIDLLLLEQLHLSGSFVSWLTSRLGIPEALFGEARHSVYQGNGETDLLLYVETPEGRVAVMIEDKIGAAMQPRQSERYHERGAALCAAGKAARYKTVLCAPETYLRSIPPGDGWQCRLSFEEVAQWLAQDPSPSAAWRVAILNAAGSKAARARVADEKSNRSFDSALTSLKKSYRALVQSQYHDLIATEQTGRDREYYLTSRALPSGIRFKHSFFRGEVSLILEKKWVEFAGKWLTEHAPPDTWLVPHKSEMHLRASTEIMDPDLPLEAQKDVAMKALDLVGRLSILAEQLVLTCE